MADKMGIAKLDQKLVSMRIIPKKYAAELPLVHRKLNSIVKKTGAVLTEDVFQTGNAALRAWLNLLFKQGAAQEKLTAYLRCGLAHLSYDYVESQYKRIGSEDLVTRAIVSLKGRKLHVSFFKPVVETAKATSKPRSTRKIEPVLKTLAYRKAPAKKDSVKKSSTGKKTPKPKSAVKKPPVKKAGSRKISVNKPVLKKKARVKTDAKKTAAKKPAVKKAPSKKVTAKKPSLKKTSATNATAKKVSSKKTSPKKDALLKLLKRGR